MEETSWKTEDAKKSQGAKNFTEPNAKVRMKAGVVRWKKGFVSVPLVYLQLG